MNSIVLTGGGTAGHVTPNIALVPFLLEKKYKIHYLGTPEGMERALVEKIENVSYHCVRSGKLRRYFSLQNFVDPFKVVAGYFDARKALKKINPDVVFSKGGFVSVPVVMAAKNLKIPVVLHESDYTPGLSNKIAIKYATKVLTTFEDTLAFTKNKGIFVGTPIRKELFLGSTTKARQECGFENEKPILLCTGGSQGAQAINTALRKGLEPLLQTFNIIHLCGKNNLDESLKNIKGYSQFEFVSTQMQDFLVGADVIISRAGANSIFEFLALSKPALLIPLPSASSRGDQVQNAKYFKSRGYCDVLQQEQITTEILTKRIISLYENKQTYIQAMQQEKNANGTNAVLEQIYSAAKK